MGNLTFIEFDGTEHTVDLEEGKSLLQIAVDNGVPGVDGDCGGEGACGTCHVIVDENWMDKTGDISSEEEQMLDMTPEREATSRLCCQVKASEDLNGIRMRMPEFQM